MSKLRPIRFVELDSGVVQEERVYGGFWIKALYGTLWAGDLSLIAARSADYVVARPDPNQNEGPFIEKFDIQMTDFLRRRSYS